MQTLFASLRGNFA